MQRVPHDVLRNHNHMNRHHEHQQHKAKQHATEPEVESCEGIGRHRAGEDVADDREYDDDQRVENIPPERLAQRIPSGRVILPDRIGDHETHVLEDLVLRAQRAGDHPQNRIQHKNRHEQHGNLPDDGHDYAGYGTLLVAVQAVSRAKFGCVHWLSHSRISRHSAPRTSKERN